MEWKRYCPNCGSENVEPAHEQLWGFTKNPSIWRCSDCGYQGFAPEGDSGELEFEPEEYPLDAAVEVKDWHIYVLVAAVVISVASAVVVLATALI